MCGGLEPGEPDRRREVLASIVRALELRPGVFGCEKEVAAWFGGFYSKKSAQLCEKSTKVNSQNW